MLNKWNNFSPSSILRVENEHLRSDDRFKIHTLQYTEYRLGYEKIATETHWIIFLAIFVTESAEALS